MALSWNLNTATSSSGSAPRLLPIPIPWPGARRTCLALRSPRSSSTGSASTTGIPLQSGAVHPLRSAIVRYSSPIHERSSKDDIRSDDDVSSGGDYGGRRGGAGEGNDASGGDRGDGDASMELQVRPLRKRKPQKVEGLVASALEIINNVLAGGNAVATVLARLKNNPTIRFLLQLMVAPFSEGTALWVVLMEEDPSFSDSCTTISMVVNNNQVGDESSYSSDNDIIDESASARNNHNANLRMVPVNVNHSEVTINVHDHNGTRNRHPSTAPSVDTTPVNSPEVIKKGFLGFLYTLVWALFMLYSALVTFSVTYPGSAKALVSFDEAWTKAICVINLMSCFGSVIMLPFASRFKDGESTNDHDGFGIFIWALYLLLLALIPEYFLTLHVYLHIPKWAVWSLGTAIFSLKVLPTVRYIEGQRPTIVSICTKYWKKLKCCRCRPTLLSPSGGRV